ncbi:MAG: hypothetical protein A2284_05720 [Deltaproteobacteria bacterium RIFOXYA12_FULL_61_11]|nr:MAG: hypothetical protein A2284_05720 [Deltaproteobacteria bacterium RIFOXYA12_FULL_61_11]
MTSPNGPPLLLLVELGNGLAVEQNGAAMVYPPLGLASLASTLRAHFGKRALRVHVLDAALEARDSATLASSIVAEEPWIVGLRALSPTRALLHQVAATLKALRPELPILAGGPAAHASPDLLLSDPHLELVCPGEGEQALISLLEILLPLRNLPRPLPVVPGLLGRTAAGGRLDGGTAILVDPLDLLPPPALEDLNLRAYIGQHAHPALLRPHAFLMTTRGCPCACAYCHQLFGRKVRRRSAGHLLAELTSLRQEHGIEDIVLLDDAFNLDLGEAKHVLATVAKAKLGLRLYFPNGLRGDRVDEELLDLLVAAGTVEVVYALETASPRLQELLGKRLNLEAVQRTIERSAARGLIVGTFFMLGFPGEREEELLATADLAIANLDHLHFPYIAIVRAFRGTRLYTLARELGYPEAMLERHADLALGCWEGIRSEDNFVPVKNLRRAQNRILAAFCEPSRMSRMLTVQRQYFSSDELVLRYRSFLGCSSDESRAFLRRCWPLEPEGVNLLP